MMSGPGPYDDVCAMLRRMMRADGIVMIALFSGGGRSLVAQLDADTASRLPETLEQIAAGMRARAPSLAHLDVAPIPAPTVATDVSSLFDRNGIYLLTSPTADEIGAVLIVQNGLLYGTQVVPVADPDGLAALLHTERANLKYLADI